MTTQNRVWLFLLCATTMVVTPAVLMNTYHTLSTVVPGAALPTVLIMMLPLATAFVIAAVGMFFSIFHPRA